MPLIMRSQQAIFTLFLTRILVVFAICLKSSHVRGPCRFEKAGLARVRRLASKRVSAVGTTKRLFLPCACTTTDVGGALGLDG